MNILYILGNGFDKAQKMATGYPDFYKYLTDKVKNESALLGKMKSAITENTELWARSGILAKLKEFGADVASNIVANILTNPMIWGGL